MACLSHDSTVAKIRVDAFDVQPMATEATEDNSEDSEGVVSKAYARFKPLVGVFNPATTRQDAEVAGPSGNHIEREHVFYGHDGYYVFFRLHQYLYDR